MTLPFPSAGEPL